MLPLIDPNPQLVFDDVARDLAVQGYSIQPAALPEALTTALFSEVSQLSDDGFVCAGIGRGQARQVNRFNRTDQVCWIQGTSDPCSQWLAMTEQLRVTLNRQLFMGLFSYESHYARYQPGDFFKRHVDAFVGERNRLVSTVFYLNPNWQPQDGGQLLLYVQGETIEVAPNFGTLVTFLSEDVPHEVLPARRTRYSIAGWYRLNQSMNGAVDPPL